MRSIFSVIFFVGALMSLTKDLKAQCPNPQLYDLDLATFSNAPIWVNCIDNVGDPDQFDLPLASPNDILNYVIDWGDGSPTESGALWTAGTFINHTYNALGTYNVTVSETDNGCTVILAGTFTNDRKPGATATPPTTNTNGCTPHVLTFTNQTTNVSPFTSFQWEWGDQSTDNVTVPGDPGSAGEDISHTYLQGTSDCGMEVTLTAQSTCATTFVTFGPYDMWDLDTAAVAASSTQLCVGDFVTFDDVSDYNCWTGARRIQWDFSDVGGPTTGWLPAIPSNQSQTYFINGPVGSTYTIGLADSNFCGIDYTQVTVQIIAPPTAALSPDKDTACVNETINFDNQSVGGNLYHWNFDDGNGWSTTFSAATQGQSYGASGDYNIQLVADIAGSVMCRDTTDVDVNVVPSPVAVFSLDADEGCDSLEVNYTDASIDAVDWSWNFGNGDLAAGVGPHTSQYDLLDVFLPSLTVENAFGCTDTQTDTVRVYPSPVVSILTDSICLGDSAVFLNNSTLSLPETGSIMRERWSGISGSDVADLIADPDFPSNPNSIRYRSEFEGPTNNGSNFGSRIRGFVHAPENGNYVFWIASDDDSELYLSSDDNSANKVLIASVDGFTNSQQWTKYASQQSASIQLEAGKKYYIESLHKESGGGDNIAVGWQLPNTTLERPIPGNRLSPYMAGQFISSWSWDFDDGSGTSTLFQPKYSYSGQGSYYPKLTASTGKCSVTDSFELFVAPAVVSAFSLDTNEGCSPLEVEIVNESQNATTYYWKYGDGVADTLTPANGDTLMYSYFNNTGTTKNFTIELVAVGALNCRDTVLDDVSVFASPLADFTVTAPTPPCAPFDLEIENTSVSDDSSFTWQVSGSLGFDTTATQFLWPIENTSGQIQFDTATVSVVSANGCTDDHTEVFTVFPQPDYSLQVAEDTGCHPFTTNLLVSEPAHLIFWDFGDGSFSTGPDQDHTFLGSTGPDTTYHVSVAITSIFACADTLETEINVQSEIAAAFQATPITQTYPDTVVSLIDLSTGAITDYEWTFGDGDSSFVQNPVQTSYDTSGTYSIVQKVINEFCEDTAEIIVTINPIVPVAGFVGGDTGCVDLEVDFVNTSLYADEYFWDFGDGSTDSSMSPSHIYDSVGAYSVKLKVTGAGGSDSTTQINIVSVIAQPVAGFSFNPVSQFYPATEVVLGNTSSGLVNRYVWDFDDGDFDSTSSPGSHVYDTVGNYLITQMVGNQYGNCGDTISDSVFILPPLPIANFTGADTGCAPFEASFNNESMYESTYLWDFGDGTSDTTESPIHVYASPGNYNVKLEVTNVSGQDSVQFNSLVVVLDLPVAQFDLTPEEQFYPDSTVTVTNLSSGLIESYLWTFDNGDSSALAFPGATAYDTMGTYISWLYVSNRFIGCADTTSDTITINPPLPVVAFEGADTGCAPLEVEFVNESFYGETYFWDFGDGSTSTDETPSHVYDSVGVFAVKLRVTNGSGVDSLIRTGLIVIQDDPNALFSASPDQQFYPNSQVTITNSSSGNIEDYLWSFGNGDSSGLAFPGAQSYDTMGVYVLTLHVSNHFPGCADSLNDTITILPPLPVVDFSGPDTGCAPLEVSFENNSVYGEDYLWLFGDGDSSDAFEPVHSYDSAGTYTVKLVVTNESGKDSIISNNLIVVLADPEPQFLPSPQAQFYPNTTAAFINSSSGVIESWVWDFGQNDSSSQLNPGIVDFDTIGDYIVTLTVANHHPGCLASYSDTIEILPPLPTAQFAGGDTGCAPLTVTFDNLSINGSSYVWDFGDGDTSHLESPTHDFDSLGTFNVKLVVTNKSGQDSVTSFATVIVVDYPSASFAVSPDLQIYPESTVNIINTSTGQITDFAWDFGDGNVDSSAAPVLHEYDTFGKYYISIEVRNQLPNCVDTFLDSVEILPPIPIPSFSGPDSGCAPLEVTFDNTTIDGVTYLWDFGDGNFSTAVHPIHYYITPGQYSVKLTATNSSGKDSVTRVGIIKVYKNPTALFSSNPSTDIDVIAPADIFFNNLSENATVFEWEFGDGSTSSEESVLHRFIDAGSYAVVLRASNAFGCADTFELFPPLTVIDGGKIHVPNVFKPVGSLNGNSTFRPVIKGNVKDYLLRVFNRWGELIFETNDYEVGWDGTYRDLLSEQEVYVYKIEVTFFEGNQKTIIGDVTLLR